MHYEYHARTIYIACSRALSRQLILNDRPLARYISQELESFRWWIITKSLNESFLGWGKLGQKWPSFGLWPKNKSTPLALYLGLLQFISKPWKCHHRNHKKSFKVSYLSLVFFHCMTHLSYFILTHVSVKK